MNHESAMKRCWMPCSSLLALMHWRNSTGLVLEP